MNKNIIAILVGIIAILAGTIASFIILKQKFGVEEDFDEFDDFDLIDDDDDFFADDEYNEYDNFGSGSEIPYAETEDNSDPDEL